MKRLLATSALALGLAAPAYADTNKLIMECEVYQTAQGYWLRSDPDCQFDLPSANGGPKLSIKITRVVNPVDTDPIDPVDPDPIDPVDPIDPDPIDPVDPIDPDPIDPVDPVDPEDPTDPVDPVDPIDPPTDPVDPPTDPVDPAPPEDDGDNGHGNDTDGVDESNPGQGDGGPNGDK
jgi:hypothetical protein